MAQVSVVEFHAYYDNWDTFVVKELAIVSDNYRTHLVFKPPYDRSLLGAKAQRTARWLKRHMHRIDWDEGGVNYNRYLIQALCSPFDVVYTRGLDKVRFLSMFHGNVMELPCEKYQLYEEDAQCPLPQHQDVSVPCALHSALRGYKSLKGCDPTSVCKNGASSVEPSLHGAQSARRRYD